MNTDIEIGLVTKTDVLEAVSIPYFDSAKRSASRMTGLFVELSQKALCQASEPGRGRELEDTHTQDRRSNIDRLLSSAPLAR